MKRSGSKLQDVRIDSFSAVASTTRRMKILVAVFDFPAFETELYSAKFPMLYSKQ